MEKKENLMLQNKVERTMAKIDLIIDKFVTCSVISFGLLIMGVLFLSKAIIEQNVLFYIVAGLCLLTAFYCFSFKMKQLDDEFRERANNLRNYIDFLGKTDEEKEKEKRYEDGNIERLRNLIPHDKKQGGK